MGSARDRAVELAGLIVDQAELDEIELPALQWVQVGDPVITCESLCVTALGPEPLDGAPDRCIPPQVTTLIACVARDYICMNDDGIDDPEKVAAASIIQQADADMLWAACWNLSMYLGPTLVSVNYLVEGGMIFTTLQLQIGVL